MKERTGRKALRVVVLISGTGSLMAALLQAIEEENLGAEVVAVGSDRTGAAGLATAAEAAVPTFVEALADHPDRAAWNRALLQRIRAAAPDLVVSAGFMKILGPELVDGVGVPILNTHPALLPSFPGAHAVAEALAAGVKVTGCTVHLVDHGVDTGAILGQRAVDVHDGEDEPALHERIKAVERSLLVDVVRDFARRQR